MNLYPRQKITSGAAYQLIEHDDLNQLMNMAAARRDLAHGSVISYSRKVFVPLTHLCRDVCHYCTFATAPRRDRPAYLTIDEVLDIARAGLRSGCKEVLFTLGDKPELRYRTAREHLAKLGHSTTISYLVEAARAVIEQTGLLPHVNPGVMSAVDLAQLRQVSISQGIMLESTAERLGDIGNPHYGSPDKDPTARITTLRQAGEQKIPITTGILIGIGETRRERIDALLVLRDLHDTYGHLQEIIIQNFRPKLGTRMAHIQPLPVIEHLWTIAAARMIFDPDMNIQAPPNLSTDALPQLIAAGINDWGGVSPVTIDHVNPEAPWPQLDVLESATNSMGKELVERLAIYPSYARSPSKWVDSTLRTGLLRLVDTDGFPRVEAWSPGSDAAIPEPRPTPSPQHTSSSEVGNIVKSVFAGRELNESQIVRLFRARGAEFKIVCEAADALREHMVGETISYVVTRNINYTNICSFRCQFCAFSKGKMSENLRGRPYDLPLEEVAARVREAWTRGATEVCMQGGIHPSYTGRTYSSIVRTVRDAAPEIHIHAFSPLEIHQGAATLGISISDYLIQLKEAGLDTLPGTAAEILDDEVREILCPDKIRTNRWLEVMRTAHKIGFKSTATIMFGHVDQYEHWARHLIRLRDLQSETGGFTEFVPLPFVHMEAPIYLKGRARKGPTFRESILMHAIGRLALHPLIPNIQTSWVKMGPEGVRICLNAGANDLGGTLMDETITRSAGAIHGQEMSPTAMEEIIHSLRREPQQRTTLYHPVSSERYTTALSPDGNKSYGQRRIASGVA